jgi:phenylacetate-CoA ligase
MNKGYSFAIKSFILPVGDKLMKTSVSYFLKKIKKLNKYTSEEITIWQNNQLKLLINHAYTNTNYYRQLFDNHNICPEDIKSPADLDKIPVLTKKDIRNNYEDLTPSNITSIPHQKSSTGGSTGAPLVYLLDNESWSFATANKINNWERIGYSYGDKFIALGSSSLFVGKKKSLVHTLYYKLKNKIEFDGISMSDKACQKCINLIQKRKVKYIYGYASAIFLLSKFVLKSKTHLKIVACIPTSEVLTDTYRDTIQKAFNCTIFNEYGASDGGMTAFEHKEGCFEVGYNTIVRTINSESQSKKIILTDTLNFSMPLINYQLGDEVILNDQVDSKCKFNGQVLNKVLGRTSDIIELENGRVLTGPGFTILFKDIPVEYYCIEKVGVNTISCTIKKLESYNQDNERKILSTFKKHMGKDSIINLHYSDKVKYTKSGKRKYFG